MRNNHSKKSKKEKVVTSKVTINTENLENNRTLNTPISSAIEKEDREMVSFTKVKKFLDQFIGSIRQYTSYLYYKYKYDFNEQLEQPQFENLIKNSYLRNVLFILNPSWNNLNDDYEYPSYKTIDGIHELFYMISEEKKKSWVFQGVQSFEEDENTSQFIEEAFEALINNIYHEDFIANNDINYRYFTFYFEFINKSLNKRNMKYSRNIFDIGSLLQIKDEQSSLYYEYTNLEACVATKNMVMSMNSLTILSQKNISKAIKYMDIDNIGLYMNYVLIPFFSAFSALYRLEWEDELIILDSVSYDNYCDTRPHPSWRDVDTDFDEEKYKKERMEAFELQRAKRALEEEARKRIIDETPFTFVPSTPPPILNKRFAEKVEEEKRMKASSILSSTVSDSSEKSSVMNSTTQSVISHNTNSRTYVPSNFVFEHDKIPKSMKRGEKTEINGKNEGFYIFYAGREANTVFERKALVTPNGNCSMKEVCEQLPQLLVDRERNLRHSKHRIFGKSIQELFENDVKNRTLFYTNVRRTVISFCNEMSATERNDNEARMRIIELYYGPRREGETELMYMNSFMFDIFRAFVNFYTFATK